MRRVPPVAGTDCWACDGPAGAKPADVDGEGSDRPGGGAGRLARILPRLPPVVDAPRRPPGSDPILSPLLLSAIFIFAIAPLAA